MRWSCGLLIAAALLGPAVGGAASPERERYEALEARARAGDRTLDFTEFRTAAAAAEVVSDPEARDQLFAAARAGDPGKLAAAASKVLEGNYTDLDAQLMARYAARKLGKEQEEELHHWVEIGLLKALRATGDGRTTKTPMVVLSVDEEYFIFRMLGAELLGQELQTCNDHPCDFMKVKVEESGEVFTMYFDVSIPMGRLERIFSRPASEPQAAPASQQPAPSSAPAEGAAQP